MKILSVIKKSAKEQIRSFWILILTITMAPFFVGVYYLISQASQVHYDLLILNQDQGVVQQTGMINYGQYMIDLARKMEQDTSDIPLRIRTASTRSTAIQNIKNGQADALIILPKNLSNQIQNLIRTGRNDSLEIEFIGDLTNVNYMVSAIWANEIIHECFSYLTGNKRPFQVKEISLGSSGKVDDFNYYVPGLLILSVIMLMFSAAIAIVTEVENKTIIRLKLSKVSSLELLLGIGFIQVMVGLLAVFLTLWTAIILGFKYGSALGLLTFIAALTSISIITFSLILAAATKSANEILIVGNFPLLLFMFFSGAAFPIQAKELFTIAGYPITWQALMSPTHAISALKKIMILDLNFIDIIPEIVALLVLSILYFWIGVWAFKYRHMKLM